MNALLDDMPQKLQLRYAAALIKIAHLSDALNVVCCKCAATATNIRYKNRQCLASSA